MYGTTLVVGPAQQADTGTKRAVGERSRCSVGYGPSTFANVEKPSRCPPPPGAWRPVLLRGKPRLLHPLLVTGVKVWHLRAGSSFYPKSQFWAAARLLPRGAQVVLVIGEIDCREGLPGAVEALKVRGARGQGRLKGCGMGEAQGRSAPFRCSGLSVVCMWSGAIQQLSASSKPVAGNPAPSWPPPTAQLPHVAVAPQLPCSGPLVRFLGGRCCCVRRGLRGNPRATRL
jgi:hypothetical protein